LSKTVFIDTPSFCARVEKIKGNLVDVTDAKEPCFMEGPGKATVEVGEEVKEIDVYLNGTYWKRVSTASQPLSPGDIGNILEQSKKHGKTPAIPENRHDTEALRLAEDLSRYAQSAEFQERIESEKARLYSEVYGSQGDNQQETAKTPGKIGKLSPHERIYLFISSSVPISTLRHYIQAISDLVEPNIRVVMRGFVGGARFVKPTVAFLKDVLFVDPECDPGREHCRTQGVEVVIDPLLFRRYRVERVPAFVYVPSITIMDSQASEGLDSNGISDHYLVYGDVSIEYALRLFASERKSPGVEALLTSRRESESGVLANPGE
jgi:type-F conjugative transfer system pilin assembly protein TrbC